MVDQKKDMFNIDLSQAGKISSSIAALATEAKKISSDFEDANSLLVNMPSGYKSSTSSIASEIKNDLKKIESNILTASSAFDKSIENYYNYENTNIKVETPSDIHQVVSLNTFAWEYPDEYGRMNSIDTNVLRDLLTKRNAVTSDNIVYTFQYGDKDYNYNVNTHILKYKVNESEYRVYCDFYADSSISTSKIDDYNNTVTILGGSSETKRYIGGTISSINDKAIPIDTPISENSLIIVPTFILDSSGNLQYAVNSNPHLVTSCTMAGDYLIGADTKDVTNSVIGYSIGGQYATSAIKSNSDLYDKCVFVNSASYSDAIGNTTAEAGFEAFKNTELIFIESKNNNNWNTAVQKTINSMQNSGVSSNNIKFFTNDTSLTKYLDKKGISYDLIDNNKYDGHNSGYKMIRDSNIIGYLSNNRKGGNYG